MELAVMMLRLLEGLKVSAAIFAVTLVFSLPLGLFVSFGRMSKNPLIRNLVKFYISVMRGTPLMLQLMVVYFGPFYLFRIPIGGGYRLWAAFIAFVINYAAYFSEIYRGGLESISRGQYEAGQVLGMTRRQIFSKVVLLQVVKRITPPMGNEIITLIKDTALARIIGITEIIMCAERYTKQGLIWPLFSTALFFLAFVGVLTLLFGYLERKMDYFRV